MLGFVEHRRDDLFRRSLQAGPDTFVLRARPGCFLRSVVGRSQNILRRSHERLDGVDCGHRCHALGMQSSAPSKARSEALVPLGGGAPGRVAQIFGQHHDALAVYRQHKNAPGIGCSARVRLTLLIEVLKILRRTSHELFELAFRNLCASVGLERLDPFVEGVFRRLDRHPAAHLMRVLLDREVQRAVERVQARFPFGAIAGARYRHGSKDRLQLPLVKLCARLRLTRRILHRTGRLAGTAQIQMSLQQLSHQLPALCLHHSLEIAVCQRTGLLRTQECRDVTKLLLGGSEQSVVSGTGEGAHRSISSPQALDRITRERVYPDAFGAHAMAPVCSIIASATGGLSQFHPIRRTVTAFMF